MCKPEDRPVLLGVDLGERRVGLAICDREWCIASPLRSVEVGSALEALNAVLHAIAETGATRVVLGHPRNMNGRAGPKARESEQFADVLRDEEIDVVLWDERLTTAEAERHLRTGGLSRKARKSKIDAVAAQRILDSYMRAQGQSG